MNVMIRPSIFTDQLTSLDNVYQLHRVFKEGVPSYSQNVFNNMETRTEASMRVYRQKLPLNIDIFQQSLIAISHLSDVSVKKQTADLLSNMNICLLDLVDSSIVMNRLPLLHLSECEDLSALLEWNFDSFRIGFSIEPHMEVSSYFILSENKGAGAFCAETYRLGSNYSEVVCAIINYVIRNT